MEALIVVVVVGWLVLWAATEIHKSTRQTSNQREQQRHWDRMAALDAEWRSPKGIARQARIDIEQIEKRTRDNLEKASREIGR